ncbi:prephenate dehydratase [Hymenobacter psychrophilus]|uniref:prephenate dehydratase n=1 Tax=Hymenobacter psychrophilus TaxID=651662 RepID=A0A1H3JEX8_9BACT|nr:prephenate dehydratase [Hymenobacter psychrophilus]SDY38407.1 prephenate dehydratase [Hymenobacter psychrophilus]
MVAIQGFEGCFHQIAARRYFGAAVAVQPCATFGQLVAAVAEGVVAAGVIAIENSLAGSILPNYALLRRAGLRITGEVYLPIRQHLLGLPGQTLAEVREVHSHPMALLQCADFLGRHPHWQLVETQDTALSARHLRERPQPGRAAVAGELAAELFGLDILAPDIQTEPHNYTRFLVLHRAAAAPFEPRPNKASLYFEAPNVPGGLAQVLTAVAAQGVNLSKLQSCPRPGRTWHYYFHADLEFDEPAQLAATLAALVPLTDSLQVLGTYCRGAMELGMREGATLVLSASERPQNAIVATPKIVVPELR